MTDIVERLRDDEWHDMSIDEQDARRRKGAAEIERLRVLLKRWQDGQDFHMKRAERAEAERDALRNDLTAALDHITKDDAEIERLQQQLATARREALEEAARVCEAVQFRHSAAHYAKLIRVLAEKDTNMTRTLMLHDGIAPNDNEIPAFKSSKPAAGGGHDDYSEHDYGDK